MLQSACGKPDRHRHYVAILLQSRSGPVVRFVPLPRGTAALHVLSCELFTYTGASARFNKLQCLQSVQTLTTAAATLNGQARGMFKLPCRMKHDE